MVQVKRVQLANAAKRQKLREAALKEEKID